MDRQLQAIRTLETSETSAHFQLDLYSCSPGNSPHISDFWPTLAESSRANPPVSLSNKQMMKKEREKKPNAPLSINNREPN